MTSGGKIAGRLLRIVLALTGVGLTLLILTGPVLAHPLGNTSINVYERVEVTAESVRVRFVLDVSEIPAVREQRFADTDDDGRVDEAETTTYLDGLWTYVSSSLSLKLAGQVISLKKHEQALTFPPGQGGLTLMRAVFDASAPLPPSNVATEVEASLVETAFAGVPGWHEIIVVEGDGATLLESSVPATDISNELTTYPPELLSSPLSVRQAVFRFISGGAGGQPSASATTSPLVVPDQTVNPGPSTADDPLVGLIDEPSISLAAMVTGLAVAVTLGAAHAVSPGHGKTLVAAYVIGSRASLGQAFWLGMTVAVTHTAGVLILGVLAYAATEWVVPERVVGWLSVMTGVLVSALGALLAWRAWRLRGLSATAQHHVHEHGTVHSHSIRGHSLNEVSRDDPMTSVVTLRQRDVALLGIVGGLVPSTSALLLLLSSVTVGQVAFGIVLVIAFGAGMALVLSGISAGIVLVRRRRLRFWGRCRDSRVTRIGGAIPLLSGIVVIAVGFVLTVQAVQNLR